MRAFVPAAPDAFGVGVEKKGDLSQGGCVPTRVSYKTSVARWFASSSPLSLYVPAGGIKPEGEPPAQASRKS